MLTRQVMIQDVYLIAPLQFDSESFESLLHLVNWDRPGKEWFHKEFTAEELVRTLRTTADRGFITCHADSMVGAPPVPCPPMPLLKKYWFGLTPLGKDIFRYPAPWDYEINEWLFPSEQSLLQTVVEEVRLHPQKWVFEPFSKVNAVAQGLRGYTNFKVILRRLDGSKLGVHVLERSGDPQYELLQGHFVAANENESKTPEAGSLAPMDRLTNNELVILDVLQDDIESVSSIIDLLNNDLLEYKRRHFGRDFSFQEIQLSLGRLVAKGLVVVFRESGKQPVTLVPHEGSLSSDLDGLWFGLSEDGRKRAQEASHPSSSAFT